MPDSNLQPIVEYCLSSCEEMADVLGNTELRRRLAAIRDAHNVETRYETYKEAYSLACKLVEDRPRYPYIELIYLMGKLKGALMSLNASEYRFPIHPKEMR